MRYGSVCSGIEAATMAWHPLGWEPVYFSEIEPFPCSVLAHHYPNVPNRGTMTGYKDWPDEPIDLLVGGTPCQSFSVAGLRKGLADPRGNLMLTYLAIAGRARPRWIVWENVPGVLSSNEGRDFGTFLTGLGELGYGFAFRVLDAQYVRVDGLERAVPQRRRRVFVVGYLGDWRRAAAVLFDRESLRGNSPPRRRAGQGPSGRVARSIAVRGRDGTPQVELGDEVANAILTPNGGRAGVGVGAAMISMATGQAGAEIAVDFSPTLNCNHEAPIVEGPPSFSIQAGALRLNPASGPDGVGVQADHAYTLEARAEVQAVAFDTTQITSKANYSNPKAGDPCHPLAAGAHPPAVAFAQNTRDEVRLIGGDGQVVGALGAQPGMKQQAYVAQPWAVRRLTPRECERLQGFPDDFTRIPGAAKGGWRDVDDCEDVEELRAAGLPVRQKGGVWRVKDPDGPRYKALGNSMAVNAMRWIGQRIQWVEDFE